MPPSPQRPPTPPRFPQPDDARAPVWRYMDLAKFIGLLDERRLHLTRLDHLDDPFEGTPVGPDAPSPGEARAHGRVRRAVYVSSWYLGEHESEAMWRLYCPGGQGVALRTSYARLADTAAAQPDTWVGMVRYLDYDAARLPERDLLAPVMHKRIAFAHEREVRIVAVRPEALDDGRPGPSGVELEWDPAAMVDEVYIDPYAEAYFAGAVRAVVRRMAPTLEPRLVWSRMQVAPLL